MNKAKRFAAASKLAEIAAEKALHPVRAAQASVQRLEQKSAEVSAYRRQLVAASNDPEFAGALLSQANRLKQSEEHIKTELEVAKQNLRRSQLDAAQALGRQKAIHTLAERHALSETRSIVMKLMRGAI